MLGATQIARDLQRGLPAMMARINGTSTAAPSYSAGNYGVDAGNAAKDPRGTQSALTRAQWNLYKDQFQPLEDELLNKAMDRGLAERNATTAGNVARDSFDAQGGQTKRRVARYGGQIKQPLLKSINRNLGLSKALAVSGTKNQARTQTRQTQADILSSMGQVGQGISSSASRGLDAAAGMANARAEAGANARSAHSASMKSTAGTLLGMAAAAFI